MSGPVRTPYISDHAHLLEQLRTCRTFAYPEVMAKAADEIERQDKEIDRFRIALREIQKGSGVIGDIAHEASKMEG